MISSRLSESRCVGIVGSAAAAIRSTPSGSKAARRPHRNASRLSPTATPFSSIARMIASADTGTSPCCQAKPSMKMLAAIEWPISKVASRAESTKIAASLPTASRTWRCIVASGNG